MACLATTNFHYGLFGERVKGLSLFPISNILEIPVVDTHYGQYSELVAYPSTSDRNCYNKNTVDTDEKDDRGVVDDGVADNNNHQGEGNNQISDGDYKEEQEELSRSRKGFFWIKLDLPPWLHQKRLF